MIVTFSWYYRLVYPGADAYIGSDSGSPFSMNSGVTVVNRLCNFMPWSLWMSIEWSEGNKVGMERIHPDLFRNRLIECLVPARRTKRIKLTHCS